MPRTRLLLPALALAALTLTGCDDLASADHGDHGEDSPAADSTREIEVTASSFAFDPNPIEISAGEDVAIVLTSTDIEHDLVIDDIDFHVHADPGETATGGLRIDDPGTYTAYCSVDGHRAAGMEATVTVTN